MMLILYKNFFIKLSRFPKATIHWNRIVRNISDLRFPDVHKYRPCYARTHASSHARHACNHAGLLPLEHIFLSHSSGCADCIVDRRVESSRNDP